MPAAHPPTSRPYHHGDLRRALLDAALAALAQDPHATFTLRSLARDVGVSHNAPYAHFADRTALLAALADLGFADLAARGVPPAFGVLLDVLARLHGAPDAAPGEAAPTAGPADVAGAEAPRDGEPRLPAETARDALAAWSMGHGLTSLLLDQRAAVAVGTVAPTAAETEHLARAVFALLLPGLRPAAAGHV